MTSKVMLPYGLPHMDTLSVGCLKRTYSSALHEHWMPWGAEESQGNVLSTHLHNYDDDYSSSYIIYFINIIIKLIPLPLNRIHYGGLVSMFNGISTFVGYLMPKLFS